MSSVFSNKFPINAVLKDGTVHTVHGHTQLYFLIKGLPSPEYLDDTGIVKFFWKNRELYFLDALQNGELYEIFFQEAYKSLDFNDATVIDIGANIGDSSIYFALNGAKKVLAIEPQIKSYSSLVKNIELNRQMGVVRAIHAGVGQIETFAKAEFGDPQPTGGKSLMFTEHGNIIKIYSLQSLVDTFLSDTENNIMKIDCEGCEYNFLMGQVADNLNRFKQIVIEYHYGYEKLLNKLKNLGFKIRIEEGLTGFNTKANPHLMHTGLIFCEKE